MSFSGPVPNPIARKVTSEHLTDLIRNQGRETELDYADRKYARRYAAIVGTIAAVFFLALVFGLAWTGHEALVADIVKVSVGLLGGFGGGYGYARWRRDD
jgi:hypothetical protein